MTINTILTRVSRYLKSNYQTEQLSLLWQLTFLSKILSCGTCGTNIVLSTYFKISFMAFLFQNLTKLTGTPQKEQKYKRDVGICECISVCVKQFPSIFSVTSPNIHLIAHKPDRSQLATDPIRLILKVCLFVHRKSYVHCIGVPLQNGPMCAAFLEMWQREGLLRRIWWRSDNLQWVPVHYLKYSEPRSF